MQPMTSRYSLALRRLERDSHAQCSRCGKPFREDDTAHSGYAIDGAPLFVGDCCIDQIAETVTRSRWTARAYDVPDARASLWRYMDFAKLVALFKDRALHF